MMTRLDSDQNFKYLRINSYTCKGGGARSNPFPANDNLFVVSSNFQGSRILFPVFLVSDNGD